MLIDPVTKLNTIGSISSREIGANHIVRGSGMRFDIRSYSLEGMGYFSTISMTGFLGLMKMETLVLTPMERDLPLLSYDAISAFGKDTLLLELYDTQIEPADLSGMETVKERYSHLEDRIKPSGGSDPLLMSPSLGKTGRALKGSEKKLINEWLDAYIAIAGYAPRCDKEVKRKKIREYTDRLFSEGGPAVNQFKKMLGEEATLKLLGEYIFCCDAP